MAEGRNHSYSARKNTSRLLTRKGVRPRNRGTEGEVKATPSPLVKTTLVETWLHRPSIDSEVGGEKKTVHQSCILP